MLSLHELHEHIASLEQRVRTLTDSLDEKKKTIQSLLSKSSSEPSTVVFPAIGSLVAKDDDDEEDEEPPMSETGMRTTALGVTEIQSLCMNCEETGTTSLLLTSIPFFKEVVLMSFFCPHCGHRDSQIQSGGAVQDKGQRITLQVSDMTDLSRQIIKSDSCTIRLNELDFEIPPGRGVITNLEGLLTEAVESLTSTQQARLLRDGPEAVQQVSSFVLRLQSITQGNGFPLTMVLDDPAGNSFVENPKYPSADPKLKEVKYTRTKAQMEFLGLQSQNVDEQAMKGANAKKDYKTGSSLFSKIARAKAEDEDFSKHEVIQIPSCCPNCQKDGMADSCIVTLPFFKEVIIMSFNCEFCGFRDTEIKGGGAITTHGRRDILHCTDPAIDLTRDVIKSDTAGVIIPELQLELTAGSLGGLYTTVEGLLNQMKENLFGNRTFQGDSDLERTARLNKIEADLGDFIEGRQHFTLILQDPLANSYIYSPFDPPSSDPRLKVEEYVRSWDEDEDLGLHDMNVDPVELLDTENPDIAENVFSHLQKNSDKTHPHAFARGMED